MYASARRIMIVIDPSSLTTLCKCFLPGSHAQVVEEMARDLYSAVSKVFQKKTIITCIYVVIYQPAQLQQFCDMAIDLVQSGNVICLYK